jgi:hypothetical protein
MSELQATVPAQPSWCVARFNSASPASLLGGEERTGNARCEHFSRRATSGLKAVPDSPKRTLWNIGSAFGLALLRLDVICSDHLAPLLGVFCDELA